LLSLSLSLFGTRTPGSAVRIGSYLPSAAQSRPSSLGIAKRAGVVRAGLAPDTRSVSLGIALRRSFYERDARTVAVALLGCRIVHRTPDGSRRIARITEVEAYLGDGSDPSAHSHTGETPRNHTMFGPAGRLYAYRSYGIHVCANVVCGTPGSASAVLLRSAEPQAGIPAMREARGLGRDTPLAPIASGPGRLAQAMGLGIELDGISLLRGPLTLHPPTAPLPPSMIEAGPRIGISRAMELPYRYFEKASDCVSTYRRGTRRTK
jgi:DNA-3-methyladenine glycosylase